MMSKYKHLTEDERRIIQDGLDQGKSFKEIGREIVRDPTTISKEVQIRRVFKKTGGFGNKFNDCKSRFSCDEIGLCNDKACRGKACKRCIKKFCHTLCSKYTKEACLKREKPPGVCNGCKSKSKCTLEKAFYNARNAHEEYRHVLTEARSGINADENEISRLNDYVSPLLLNGQSIHHILANSKDEVMYSERTIYKYVDAGLFDARNIDLRRKVRFRPRKSNHEFLKVDKCCYMERDYINYQAYISDHPRHHTVEMDTVHGKVGGKCLLTLHFVYAHFMLAYILNACTAAAVKDVFRQLRELLGAELYVKLFPVLLGDRGAEFTDPRAIEFNGEGELVSKVFYCDPQRSQQKGSLESNHRFIRYFIPKGTSMDHLNQQHISLMMDHINSYSREELKDRSPYSMFEFLFGDDGKSALEKLGVNLICPKDIVLHPLSTIK